MDKSKQETYLPLIENIFTGRGINHRQSVLQDYIQQDPEYFTFFPKNWGLEPFPSTAQRMQAFEETSVELIAKASQSALEHAGLEAQEVTSLIVTSCTGFFAPGPDVILMQKLGLSPNVKRTLIGFMGCCAAFNGMHSAQSIIAQDKDSVVLHVCVELCSLHLQKKPSKELWVANCIFSDGCSAAVYGGETYKEKSKATLLKTHSLVIPDSQDQMAWRIGDYGFEMRLRPSVPRQLQTVGPDFLEQLLHVNDLPRSDITGWVIHPGGRKIIEVLRDTFSLTEGDISASTNVLSNHGNMSSATLYYVLAEELKRNQSSGIYAALGFGPGLTVEGALFNRVF